ncbi:hypothetical protein [Streptomyces antarcticus]|uniref:hypothetical protein n=1 Tax=Streptomyces antarcticus TaxID=2996458 RepID=UPI002270D14B|nr:MULTISPECIES: hypothetical protein [unclassified Streptomyces]MCY0944796.1 hypothetical protein [Streptomyces sp. H34-AA3]MCZ4081170.1 hypothetical protein [Streptomyces sp. H34-S5]
MTSTSEPARPRTSAPAAQHRTRFFDHRIPSLYAGRYRIDNRQILKDLGGADRVIDATPQPFDVVQPRFSFDPTGIHAQFPVPDAVGTYSQTLAHINLDTPGLPWNRPLGSGHPGGVPWMALLLFREDELPEDPDAVGLVKAGTVRALLGGAHGTGTPPDLPSESLRPDEYDEQCATVLVPSNLFDAVKPLPAEMGYLAHLREGGRPDATRSGDTPEPDEGELNAVLVANRFPAAAGGRHVVHLVSLEGHDRYLTTPAPDNGVRLVSLTSWSFTTEPDSGIGFGDLAQHLATTDGTTPRSADELRLRVTAPGPADPSAEQAEAIGRLQAGAVALPQRLETGERTLAFYRGPLTAQPAQALPAPAATRLESPGEALIYLQRYGVFDTAYAAAFTTGRTLALADAEFRTALLEFRSAARTAVRRLASHPELAARSVAALSARQLTAPLAYEAFDRLLTDDGARSGGARLVQALDQAGPQLRAGRRRTAARSRRSPGDARAVLAQPGVAGLLTQVAPDNFAKVTAWLDALRRLELLSLSHLVPDARALPAESIRFAHLDPAWVRAAVDGALSVGVGHALDSDLNTLATGGGPVPKCAVLINSSLVPNWPKIIVTAYKGTDIVEPLREAVFGTQIRLTLYPEVIDRFELAEPPRGLCFGIGDVGTIELRGISGDRIGHPMGEFPQPAGFARFLRPGGQDVLNVDGAGDALLPALSQAHGLTGTQRISSAQFALQMINAPQVQNFSRP